MTESTKDQAEISSQTGNAAAEGKAPEAKQDAPQGTEKAASSPQGEITKAARKSATLPREECSVRPASSWDSLYRM